MRWAESPYGKVPPCCLTHMPLPACFCWCPLEPRFFHLLLDSTVAHLGYRPLLPALSGRAHKAVAVDGSREAAFSFSCLLNMCVRCVISCLGRLDSESYWGCHSSFYRLRTKVQGFIEACGHGVSKKKNNVWPHAFSCYGSGLCLILVHFCIKGFSSDLMPVNFYCAI